MSSPSTIFFLGATGYIGSQLLPYLARDFPGFHITVLLRSVTSTTQTWLSGISKQISTVQGSFGDPAVIQEQAAKADIVINTASNDLPIVELILAVLEKASASRPGAPPLYIHTSGLGILSDNARGEYVAPANIREYTDIGFTVSDCPPTNAHVNVANMIIAAGTRRQNPIRTIIIFPGFVYGVGEGVQKVTLPLRLFLNLAKQHGFAGSWGPGLNKGSVIHVKDLASSYVTVLKAALEGKADEGAEGLYFAGSNAKVVLVEWSSKLGDILYNKGLAKKGGSEPLPDEIVAPYGDHGWSLFAGNSIARSERLARLGWKATESVKASCMDTLLAEVEAAIQQGF